MKHNKMLEKIKSEFPEEEFLIADGYDAAIIGVEWNSMRVIYSVSKVIDILCMDMLDEDAIEYFHYNIAGAYVGDKTPIWCYDNLI